MLSPRLSLFPLSLSLSLSLSLHYFLIASSYLGKPCFYMFVVVASTMVHMLSIISFQMRPDKIVVCRIM